MNNNVTVKDWSDALRSGKYKQGSSFLHAEDRFCCLGVLCDLIDSNGWRLTEEGATDLTTVYAFGDKIKEPFCEGYSMIEHDVTQILPEYVADQFGITLEQQDILTQHNDNGTAFDIIADMIDKGLDNLKRPHNE